MEKTTHTHTVILTEKESSILRYIAEGKTIGQIAILISSPVAEVEIARQNIMEKLQLFTIAELTKNAIQRGLTTINE